MMRAKETNPYRSGVRAAETGLDEGERAELWRRYADEGDERARERLILAYAPLVKYIAGRIGSRLPPHVDESDLVSSGLFGLISAVERFDPRREIRFETFAGTRIRGAIVDELRSLDWVPRSVRSRAREIRDVNAKLEHQLHRAPTDAETAASLEIPVAEVQGALVDISNSSMAALDGVFTAPDGGGRISLLDTIDDASAPDPVRELDAGEVRDRLADAIARLPERQRLVVGLYYYENLTLAEIGDVLGVTESRAAQLRTKSILRLQSALQEDPVAMAASA